MSTLSSCGDWGRLQMARAFVETLKETLPWYLKIAAKLVLARLPVPYAFWQRASLFRHGEMDKADVAIGAFQDILQSAGHASTLDGLSVLELGPGDALMTTVIAKALGARAVTMIDAGTFARQDFAPYRELISALQAKGYDLSAVASVTSLAGLLEACNGRYLTKGLASLSALPAGSIDFAFSKAVLEHIRLDDFKPMMKELWRVMSRDAVALHVVDLQDHLAHGLHNLRFPRWLWELPIVAGSGFYTNRIRYSTMLDMFREAGFEVEVTRIRRFDRPPAPRREKFAPAFRGFSAEELSIADFDVLLRKI